MITEKTLKEEIKYCREVLGKTIIEENTELGNIRDNRSIGYQVLAKKYLSQDFVEGRKNCVHHLNFDHGDNRLCNLVVVNYGEHLLLHSRFDPSYKEVIKHRNDSNRGKPRSEETRRKMSEGLKGKTAWNKGLKSSDETRKKLSESHKGKHPSDETRQKLSESHIGKHWKLSEESRKRMSESKKGRHWKLVDGKRVYY